LYFYEGRTTLGLAWITLALFIELGAVLAAALALVAIALSFETSVQSPSGSLTPALLAFMAVCGIGVGQVFMALVFLLGLDQTYRGRHEYGLEHARSLDRAVVFLIVFLVVDLVSLVLIVSPLATGTTDAGAPSPTLLLLGGGNPMLAPLGAFFAGLCLRSLTRSLSSPMERHRLIRGLVLGVVGATTGPALLGFAVSGSLTDVSTIVSGILASALAGQGISALSLLLFATAFRNTRKNLEAGRPMPALPRVERAYPWAAGLPYAYPPPPNPPRPPRE
jgi:hypothetical protein